MTPSQKTIVIIEVVLIVIGGILLVMPGKKVDLQPLWQEFEATNTEYNRLSVMSYRIVVQNMKPVQVKYNTIIEKFNSKKPVYNEIVVLVEQYKKDLKNLAELVDIYEPLLREYQESKGKLSQFINTNSALIEKSESLAGQVESSKSNFEMLNEKLQSASTLEELTFIKEKLASELGRINSLESLAENEASRIKAEEQAALAAKKKTTTPIVKKTVTPPKPVEIPVEKPKVEEPKGKTAPAKLMYKAMPDYPDNIKEMGFGGLVKIKVTVTADGRPKDPKIIRSSGNDRLDANSLRSSKECTFEPAYDNGQKIESEFIIEYEFKAY